MKNSITPQKIIVCFLLFLVSASAFAETKYVGHHNVKRYYPVSGTMTYLMLETTHQNPAGCTSSIYYAIPKDHPEFEEYRKLILTAKASGHKLGVYLWADPGKCQGSYPLVYSMFIQ